MILYPQEVHIILENS